MARGKILQGDAIHRMNQLAPDSAQLIVADPPYYQVLDQHWDRQWRSPTDYLAWTQRWLAEAIRVLRPDGLLYCFGQLGKREHLFLQVMANATECWHFHDLIIWDRTVGYRERRDSFTPATEMILVLRKSNRAMFNKDAVREPYAPATVKEYLRDKRYKDRAARERHLAAGKFATNLWRIPSLRGNHAEKCGHPAQKPLRLIERIVLSSSNAGDLVLDPFLGSGTTAVAALRHGRNWVGIEADVGYVEMARRRMRYERKKLRKWSGR